MASAAPKRAPAGREAVRTYEGGLQADTSDESKVDAVEETKKAKAAKAAKDAAKTSKAAAALPDTELDGRAGRIYEGGATLEVSLSPNVDTFAEKKEAVQRREIQEAKDRKARLAKQEEERLARLEAAAHPPTGTKHAVLDGGLTEDTTAETDKVDLVAEKRATAAAAAAASKPRPKAVDVSEVKEGPRRAVSVEGGWTEDSADVVVSPSAARESEEAKARAVEAEAAAAAAKAAALDEKVHSPSSGGVRTKRSSSYDGGWTEDTSET
mmetsp:Transcript_83812/g.233420  ORF Transcript_83812/g.233420 Transcript_83812/m.233420 type:complete len:268 (-) Transcript_83812:164-967(-)